MYHLPRKEKVAATEGAGKTGQIRKGLKHQTQVFYHFLYFVSIFQFHFCNIFFLLRLSSAQPVDVIIKWKVYLSN